MGQEEVKVLLKTYPTKCFSTKEIAKSINICFSCIQVNMKKMRKWELVEYRKVKDGSKHWMEYRHKR